MTQNQVRSDVVSALPAGLRNLNRLSAGDLAHALRKVCGSSRWVEEMVAAQPWGSVHELRSSAARADWLLADEDWLEAFSHHPRIGDPEVLRARFAPGATKQWTSGEQAGVNDADQKTIEALAKGNVLYEEKFGFVFLICATGLTAAQMLTALESRIGNSRATELNNAATQQAKITRIRLDKLLDELAQSNGE